MLVLIDESGDPGFKVVKGSSSHFVIAMVIFPNFKEAERVSEVIGRARDRLRVKPEFKFGKACSKVRDGFFEGVLPFDFKVRALVVDKSHIYSENLRTSTERFYNYSVQLLLRHDGGSLKDANVKIDGCGNREFMRELNAYLRRAIPQGKVAKVRMYDSRSDNLLQLADMCAGAILKARREPPARDRRWLDQLQRAGRVEDLWDFR